MIAELSHVNRGEGRPTKGEKNFMSVSSSQTERICAHGAVFIVNTADCRLIGGDCVYLHVNLPNYTARPATYRRRAIENLTRPETLRRNISGLFFSPLPG